MRKIFIVFFILVSTFIFAENYNIYIVQKGDYLFKVSQYLGVSTTDIIKLNNLKEPYAFNAGQILKIPDIKKPELFLNLANTMMTEKNYNAAILYYTNLISNNPDLSVPYSNRGLAYKILGNSDMALLDYDKALQLNPNLSEVYNNRGNIYFIKADYEKALSDFNSAMKDNNNYADALYNRANTYYKLKNYGLAVQDLNKVVSILPNYAEAYNNLGVCYIEMDNNDMALKNFIKAKEMNSTMAEVFLNLGIMYEKASNKQKAIENYKLFIEKITKDNPDYNTVVNKIKILENK